MNFETFIIVRFRVEGFHCWPVATGNRAYLAHNHRHIFYIEAKIEVFEDDREIEFHDFLDFCKENFPGGDFGSQSCEMLAGGLVKKLTRRWPGRRVSVSVFEDNEVGAVVYS